jgi:hypothetical protein
VAEAVGTASPEHHKAATEDYSEHQHGTREEVEHSAKLGGIHDAAIGHGVAREAARHSRNMRSGAARFSASTSNEMHAI